METKREPAVAGLFYENKPQKLLEQLRGLFIDAVAPVSTERTRALILPHAGYVFSGRVAASGINQLNPKANYQTIFVIGTSHRMDFDGASVFRGSHFNTPIGSIPVCMDTVQQLTLQSSIFSFGEKPHEKEHSLEVQLPFLQYHLKEPFEIVPILIGTRDQNTCKEIAKVLTPYFTEDNLFVISTDFSHYPNYNNAINIDQTTAKAIISNNSDALLKVLSDYKNSKIEGLATPCCGWSSLLTLLYITEPQNGIIGYKQIQYENSGDSALGDKTGVVGYHAILVSEKVTPQLQLSEEEKELLVQISLESIESGLTNTQSDWETEEFSSQLKIRTGAFVSIYKNGKLNGCIGHIGDDEPLWLVVKRCARSAAFEDSRFTPIQTEDLKQLSIEISVLTPPRKISDIEEIKPGTDGILIKKGAAQGTYLPQVAERMGWDRLEMLQNCSKNKAGIGVNGWKDADIYIYEAIIIKQENVNTHNGQ